MFPLSQLLCLVMMCCLTVSVPACAEVSGNSKPAGTVQATPPTQATKPADAKLQQSALEVANDLGILDLMEKLQKLGQNVKGGADGATRLELLSVRQELVERLFTTFLEVNEVKAEIDREIMLDDELRRYLEGRRDRNIRMNTVANFLSGGAMQMISSGMQITTASANGVYGNEMEVAEGFVQTAISTFALKEAQGKRKSSGINTNMLAGIFNRPVDDRTTYPDAVWAYLNHAKPTSPAGLSRRDDLIGRWVKTGRIPPVASSDGKKQIDLLTGTVPDRNVIGINYLITQSAMLADFRTEVTQIGRELLQIMLEVRARQFLQ